jgi:7-carboxy-7-deazaguanine synthase
MELVRARNLDARASVTFSPVWEGLAAADLGEWIRDSGRNVRLGLQLHKLLWGDVPGK